MEQRVILHIVDGDSRSRAEQARIAFALSQHAEVYSDLAELLDRPPHDGIIMLRQRAMDVTLGELFERLGEEGVWLPVIVCSEEPRTDRVVDAIKNGALDYLKLPLEAGRLARSLTHVIEEAEVHGRARQRMAEARRRVVLLSKREREVLEWLARGSSNKVIARELDISPRTVEIHRANMMTKLRAGHAAEAVRIWLQAGFEAVVPGNSGEGEGDSLDGAELPLVPELARMIRLSLPGDDSANDSCAKKNGRKRRAGSK